jgi:hypothetical protein
MEPKLEIFFGFLHFLIFFLHHPLAITSLLRLTSNFWQRCLKCVCQTETKKNIRETSWTRRVKLYHFIESKGWKLWAPKKIYLWATSGYGCKLLFCWLTQVHLLGSLKENPTFLHEFADVVQANVPSTVFYAKHLKFLCFRFCG